ncbi:hypothetical protein JL101_035835 (plasmid) [Skermanella rosea]|uniref:hypothetical protein n=1 Tax=Skermanella rosea TaxID=1817965 RepID=UPI001931A859|nr:hypothetical protein [Skermanella rosea]UEM08024.1 hypothetical protein JL101_035835 [Skermanella rosea]
MEKYRAQHLQHAIDYLTSRGFVVERTADIPGLFYVDGGPELTIGQLIDFASKQ